MRTETTTRTLYKFSELSPEAQQHALETQSRFESEDFDPEFVYDDAATIAELFGLDIRQTRKIRNDGSHFYDPTIYPTIYYSGFCYQGDGACFEGTYSYKAGALKDVKGHAGQDERLPGDILSPSLLRRRSSLCRRSVPRTRTCNRNDSNGLSVCTWRLTGKSSFAECPGAP